MIAQTIIDNVWRLRFGMTAVGRSSRTSNADQLRLILGVGRSGTSWLSRVLSESSTPMRSHSEPLHYVRPKLRFHHEFDRMSIDYRATLEADNPLLCAYRALAGQASVWDAFKVDEFVVRNDDDWQVALVKETHALLATEALLKAFRCPTVMIVRNPLYSVDSLLVRDGGSSYYLNNEEGAVMSDAFMSRFFPRRSQEVGRRLRHLILKSGMDYLVTRKVLTVALINHMFRTLAAEMPFVKLIAYEDLCRDPWTLFADAAQFLGVEFEGPCDHFLKKTTKSRPGDSDPHSIYRDTANQLDRGLSFVQPHVEKIYWEAMDVIGTPGSSVQLRCA